MVFDGPGAKLPIATLRSSGPRRRVLVVEIARWLSLRWAWVRPRAVPLLAAMVGLLITVGAMKYAVVCGHRHRLELAQRAHQAVIHHERHARRPAIHFVVKPVAHRDRPLQITLTPIELP
jgi:hypothetical protein